MSTFEQDQRKLDAAYERVKGEPSEAEMNASEVLFHAQIPDDRKIVKTAWGWATMPTGYDPSIVEEYDFKYDPMVALLPREELRSIEKRFGWKLSNPKKIKV